MTHYLLNAPQSGGAGDTYVPLGRLDALQDPRLVRVGQYEQSGSGRHDAAKVLGPYVASLLARRRQRRRVAILLHDAGSVDKLAQTLLEMIRGGLADQPVDVTVFCETAEPLDRGFVSGLPCAVTEIASLADPAEDRRLRTALVDGGFEHLMLFESSGMYNGEDVPWLISHLLGGRLDAVWGSRRLSVRDIEESYRLKYRQRALMGSVSRVGSHALSLAYLLLLRAVRVRHLVWRAGRAVADALRVAGAAGPQAGQPVPAVWTAASQGRDVRSAGALLLALAGAGPAHHVCRRGVGRRHDCVAAIRPGVGRRAGGQARARRFGAAGGLA